MPWPCPVGSVPGVPMTLMLKRTPLKVGDFLFISGHPDDLGYTFVYKLTRKHTDQPTKWTHEFWSMSPSLRSYANAWEKDLVARPKITRSKATALLHMWGYSGGSL